MRVATYQEEDVKMYPYASPNPSSISPYPGVGEWPVKGSSHHLNSLEKVYPVISDFEKGNSSPCYGRIPANPIEEYIPSSKSSDVQTANFECQNKDYLRQFENSDDSSSIHSAIALEVSSEYIKHDFLSVINGEEPMMPHQRLIQFYNRPAQYSKPESPKVSVAYSMPFNSYNVGLSFSAQPIKKTVPLKILKRQKTPSKRPSFSGNEFVSSFKRQKISDSQQDFDKDLLDTTKVRYFYCFLLR